MALTNEERQRWDEFQDMFATPAWQALKEELAGKIDSLAKDALEAPSWEDVCRIRGEAKAFSEIFNLEQYLYIVYRSAEEEDAAL